MKQLTIPSIEETKQRFLSYIKPLLDDKIFEQSKDIAENFFSKSAPKLQALLEDEKNATSTSWLYKHWIDMYLNSKGSVNVDGNFCLNIKINEDLKNKSNEDLLNIFSKSLGKLCEDYKNGNFEEMLDFRGNKLCLNQFEILRGASRIHTSSKDMYNLSSISSNYITIFYKNKLFKVQIFNENGILDIKDAINQILKDKKENEVLSYLSFLPADIAGAIRDDLYANNQYFDIVDNSLFNISLIDEEFKTEEEKRHFNLYLNGENSWALKPLNFIYNLQNKDFFVNAEHTFEDAGTIIEIIRRTLEYSKTEILSTHTSKAVYINEYVDEKNKNKILQYREEYLKLVDSFDCNDLHIEFPNDECQKFSKDALMQMILLYAQYKTYDKLHGIYEAVDMKEYSFGRTECVRVLSTQAVNFIKALDKLDGTGNKKELLELLNKANIEHKTRIKDAKKASGIDRHLMGLKVMMAKADEKTQQEALKFFDDIAYKEVTQNFISTTCTGTLDFIGYLLFTPVVYNGLGITYLKEKNEVVYLIAYHKQVKNKADIFAKNAIIATEKLRKILQ